MHQKVCHGLRSLFIPYKFIEDEAFDGALQVLREQLGGQAGFQPLIHDQGANIRAQLEDRLHHCHALGPTRRDPNGGRIFLQNENVLALLGHPIHAQLGADVIGEEFIECHFHVPIRLLQVGHCLVREKFYDFEPRSFFSDHSINHLVSD